MTFQVFLSEKAREDLDEFPTKIAAQIRTDCARLADDPISISIASGLETIEWSSNERAAALILFGS